MKVTLHKSTDGELHSTAKECAKRNIELRVLAAAQKVTFNMDQFREIYIDGRKNVLDSNYLASFIAANQEVLRKLLAESLIVRRPRKPKLQVGMVVVI